MCGICGIFNFDTQLLVDRQLLQKMMKSIYHRGPDDKGLFVQGNIGFGMQRLSIIDLERGRQPMHNEDKTVWVVHNGEIYNYHELRHFLISKGHYFSTNSDTEVIVHLYEDERDRFVEKLRGMFAVALLDVSNEKLILVRDRLGIKPLYYSLDAKGLTFASEIKAILEQDGFQREIDLQALDAFLSYTYIPAPLTIFKNIRKLLPGHMLICTKEGVTSKEYWNVIYEPNYEKTEDQFLTEFAEIFQNAVQMHLISDVPLGIFLSGGIDSSLVTALANGTDNGLKTFTVGFAGNIGAYDDERKYARPVSKRYHTDHNELEVAPDLAEILNHIVEALDEPVADDGIIPTYCICELAAEKVKVGLTGLGGDEMFGGYERYLGFRLNRIYEKFPGFIRTKLIRWFVNMLPELQDGNNRVNHLKRFVRASRDNPAETYLGYITTASEHERQQLYSLDLMGEIDFHETEEFMLSYFNSTNAKHPMDRAFYQDIKTYLPDDLLTITDRLSMAHSLELRVPFLDHEVVEYCAKIPWQLKMKLLRKKFLLKKLAKNYLPSEVIKHRKLGFASPMSTWLKSDLRNYVTENLEPINLRRHGLFRSDFVKKVLDDHFENREMNDKLIFSLLIFQKWYDLYM